MSGTIAPSVSYHAWNKDQSMVALSPNTNEVWIFDTNKQPGDSSKWTRKHVLDEHGGQVSGIDWCPATNLLVSCGFDRNAYVWSFDEKSQTWKPALVILRINRAATQVKWSPAGNKFAVASGAKCVPVCHYDPAANFWVSKMIKKHKSTVLSLAWCVNNKFIVTGSSDMKCRVFSAFLDNLDPAEDDGFGEVWPNQHEFGEVLVEFDQAKSWVHSVAWSPGAFRLAFGSHGSTMHFVQLLAGSKPIVQNVKCRDLPYLDLQFVNENAVVAAGFDFNIDLFTVKGGSETEPNWQFNQKVDKGGAEKAEAKPTGAFGASRAMFANQVDKGIQGGAGSAGVPEPNTKHKNIVTNIQLIADAQGNVKKISTAGIDGRVVVWDISTLIK